MRIFSPLACSKMEDPVTFSVAPRKVRVGFCAVICILIAKESKSILVLL